jgi:hypothetical protein
MRATGRIGAIVGLGLLAATGGPVAAAPRDGRISVTVADAPARTVLDALARRLGARLVWRGGGAERPVSVALDDVALAEAVARIVPGRSFVLVEDARGRLREIRVLSAAEDSLAEPVEATPSRPAIVWVPAGTALRGIADVERAAGDPDPTRAAAALEAIARGEGVLRVRMTALERLAQLGTVGVDGLLAAADGGWGAELAPRALALLERFAGEDERVDRRVGAPATVHRRGRRS